MRRGGRQAFVRFGQIKAFVQVVSQPPKGPSFSTLRLFHKGIPAVPAPRSGGGDKERAFGAHPQQGPAFDALIPQQDDVLVPIAQGLQWRQFAHVHARKLGVRFA